MKLYFRDHVGVFFSLLGAIISFVLYILFLKKTMSGDWSSAPNGSQLLDLWLISGTLAVASMTTTLTGISQMVMDKENHVWDDLRLTNLSPAKMVMAYLMSAASIGAVMQMVLLVIMVVYFKLVDGIDLPWKSTPEVLALMIVSSLMMAALNYMIVGFVRRQNTLSLISTIVGTLSGFLVGVYVPIGVLPDAARLIMKLTPRNLCRVAVSALPHERGRRQRLQQRFCGGYHEFCADHGNRHQMEHPDHHHRRMGDCHRAAGGVAGSCTGRRILQTRGSAIHCGEDGLREPLVLRIS
jgi:multidrug/hemolysin transport system permease protein